MIKTKKLHVAVKATFCEQPEGNPEDGISCYVLTETSLG